MHNEIVLQGLPLTEGPVWSGAGALTVCRIGPAGVCRIDVDAGTVEEVACFAGGANGAQAASDGGFVVANNGGIDFGAHAAMLGLNEEVPYEPATPGLQRIYPDGRAEYLADDGFLAPNDLIVAADGTLFFTDPPAHGAAGRNLGRLWRWRDGAATLVADGFEYINGIAQAPDGRLLVVEGPGLMWVDGATGDTDWFIEKLPGSSPGDGFAFDVDGTVWCAAPAEHCIWVFDLDGSVVDKIVLGDDDFPTNCCFGGADNRTLFVTELAPGRIWAVEGTPSPGLPVYSLAV